MKKLIITFYLLSWVGCSFAGPEHDHGESAFATGSVTATRFELSDQQMANLDIRSSTVELVAMQSAIEMLAFTEVLPENTATVSPHFDGKVIDIKVKLGERVKKGQALVRLKPIGIGSKSVTLYSEINGFVMQLEAGLGQIVSTGGEIMRMAALNNMLVRGVAYETPMISTIEVGQHVEVHLDIDPSRHIHGSIQRINRMIDPEDRTFSVYALIETPQNDIQPGLQGTIEIFTDSNSPVKAIPKRALLGELGSYFVYVIKDKHVEKRDVIVGDKTGHHIEIVSGLSTNDRVVTNGNYQLQYLAIGGVKQDDHEDYEDHDHHDIHVH